MLNHLLSYLKPVKRVKNGEIIIIIRGITFKSASWEEIIKQIKQEIEFNQRQLSNNVTHAGIMMSSTSAKGKMNMGAIILRNTLKNIEALEAFLNNNR